MYGKDDIDRRDKDLGGAPEIGAQEYEQIAD